MIGPEFYLFYLFIYEDLCEGIELSHCICTVLWKEEGEKELDFNL